MNQNTMDKNLLFNTIRKSRKSSKSIKIPSLCRGKNVLDVGCVGQDISCDNPGWLHTQIKNVTLNLDGVDINDVGIRKLKEKGYSMYTIEELKVSGNKYDIVVIADVIEHINDPVSFLKFYSSFLAENGLMIVTTPNAHGIRNFTNILIRNNYQLNPEHTFWFCPKTFMEVTDRAGLKFVDFCWLEEYYRFRDVNGLKFRFIYLINLCFQKIRSGFYPNFMFVLSK